MVEEVGNEKVVKLSVGEVIVKKPTAGIRNKAALSAYKDGNFNEVLFIIEMLPYCIKSHPFGTTPLKTGLDNLSITEYDKLIDEIKNFMGATKGDVAKKSE